ncbi:MAG: Transcriptional regulator PadR-like family [Phormidesmis priestleyi Ana]|uniref:Transcriptional regulator PadR-like family n=1 Tax=Phormidesmis priestleyi Ana TaxID=1666911 RepID=A0A0P8C403_9CYAN|nr:MAG: Transcriptional regulator PadR-like family [Phormidesmis priestleyi Ana]
MAAKVTPLYAETLTLLKLWALDETPAAKSKFITSSTKAYTTALHQLVAEHALVETPKNKRTNVYALAEAGKARLAQGLANPNFAFSSVAGPKTTNALLKWLRENNVATPSSTSAGSSSGSATASDSPSLQNGHSSQNGHSAKISSYQEFTQTALDLYEQLNRDYNLGNLVPIYRIRRELGDRLPRQQFNQWLLDIQSDDYVQLMGGDLPNATPDQLEDSVAIPGGGTRFYVKRL